MSKMELETLKEEARMKILNSLRLCFKKINNMLLNLILQGLSCYPSFKIFSIFLADQVTTECDKMFTMK